MIFGRKYYKEYILSNILKELGVDDMKIGRNDPCSCGSGIKYKKCCMDKDDQEEHESRRADLTPVNSWILEHDELKNYYESLMSKYFTKPPTKMEMGMLLDAFIFDYKIPES